MSNGIAQDTFLLKMGSDGRVWPSVVFAGLQPFPIGGALCGESVEAPDMQGAG